MKEEVKEIEVGKVEKEEEREKIESKKNRNKT